MYASKKVQLPLFSQRTSSVPIRGTPGNEAKSYELTSHVKLLEVNGCPEDLRHLTNLSLVGGLCQFSGSSIPPPQLGLQRTSAQLAVVTLTEV